jgi:hypothetical protein
MKPTNKLRFVRRLFTHAYVSEPIWVQVLEQWWESEESNYYDLNGELVETGEWIEIPVENDE